VSDFLAEASVLIRPDTTTFRSQLVAELTAATRGITVPVPVVATVDPASLTATKALTTAKREEAVATELAGAAAAHDGLEKARLARLDAAAANASRSFALAQQEVVGASSAAAAARVQLTRSTAAVAAAEKLLATSIQTGNVSAVGAASIHLGLAKSYQTEALAALEAAAANRALSAAEGQASRGAASAGLSLLGLRGATLAATGPFLAGAAAAITFAKSVSIAANTEQQLNTFRAVTEATGDEMQRVAEQARALGRDISLPGVSAGDAAQAMTELAKAGLDVQQSMDAARGTLLLAAAAGIENAEAVELTANSLNAFGLAGTEAARVADLLAGASIAAQGSITDMGLALQQSAAVARQVGLSLDDTVTFITLLAENGLRASDAGTSLRTALIRLINPTKAARAAINELGIEIRDIQGNVRADVFAQFAAATEDLTAAQRDATLAIIFGQDAIRAAAILAREGTAGFEEAAATVTQVGNAARVAGARTEGFSGQVSALSSNMETLGGTIGSLVLPPLTSLIGGFNLAVGGINAGVEAFGRLLSSTRDVPQGIQEISIEIDRLRRELDDLQRSGGEEISGGLQKQIADLERQLAELISQGLSPALTATDRYGDSMTDAASRTRDFTIATGLLGSALADAASRAQVTGQAIDTLPSFVSTTAESQRQLRNEIERRNQAILEAQIAGDKSLERSLLVEQQRTIRVLIGIQEDIISRGGTGSETAQRQRGQLLSQLSGVVSSIEAIDSGTVADAKRAAAEAKSRAGEIARARREAAQAIVDALDPDQTRAENQIARAALTQTLADDVKANQNFRDVLKAQLDLVRRTVADAKVKAAAIANLTQQLFQVQLTLRRLRQQQADQAKQAAEDARQRRDDILQARIELAEVTGNRQAEVAARKARIKALQDEIRAAKGDTLRILQLRTEIARERQALKELEEEVTDRGKAFKELSFAFLQAQQGFAANLFGNLIPGGATGGLVGNVERAPQVAPFRPTTTPEAGIGIEAGLDAARGQGISQGQFSVLIDLTRQIVRILGGVRTDNQAPESRYNLAVQRAQMDGPGAHGGV
jgi:TP901 family phage tail tape measure protein